MMQLAPYPDMDRLLNDLLHEIRKILDKRLVGLYLYGSLVTGGFDKGVSDFDLLAATRTDIDNKEFDRLQELHLDFVDNHPEWDNRVEIAYLSVAGLRTFKTQESKMAVISPGEPFHFAYFGACCLEGFVGIVADGITLWTSRWISSWWGRTRLPLNR